MSDSSGSGGRPGWLADDASVKVDINGVEDFGTRVRGELDKNFQPSFENGIQPVMKEAGLAPFGMGGMREGRMFGTAHANSMQAMTKLVGDVQKSMMAISMAAMSIAAEYGGGDAMNQATLDDVRSAFGGPGAGQTLDDVLKAQDLKSGEHLAGRPSGPPDPASTYPTGPGADRDALRSGQVVGAGTPGELRIGGDNEGIETRHPEDGIRELNEDAAQPGWAARAAQGAGETLQNMNPYNFRPPRY